LNYALMIDGNNTSAFNFSGEFARDYTIQSSHPFVTKSNNSAMNSGLLGFTWYYFDTEFAYDPQIANQPQSSYSLHLNSWATSTAQVSLAGDVNGTINGTITGSGSGASLIGSTAISIANNSYTSAVVGTDNGQKTASSLLNKINSALSSALTSALQSDLNSLATSGLSLLTHPLGKVFNSLLSSKPSNQQRVNLNLAAKITLNGNITTNQPAMNFAGALPGTARGDQSGWLPYYNSTLGVFNLSTPPVVKYKVVTMYPPPPPGSKDVQYLVQVPPSVVLNPAIANEVTMGPVSVTLVYQKQYSGMDRAYNPNYLSSTALSNFTLINNVYGNEWYAFSAPYTIRYDWWTGTPDPNIVVQIAFTIYPNNGAPPVDIVKTYRPTFVPG
jgi:hypothetical protein